MANSIPWDDNRYTKGSSFLCFYVTDIVVNWQMFSINLMLEIST